MQAQLSSGGDEEHAAGFERLRQLSRPPRPRRRWLNKYTAFWALFFAMALAIVGVSSCLFALPEASPGGWGQAQDGASILCPARPAALAV